MKFVKRISVILLAISIFAYNINYLYAEDNGLVGSVIRIGKEYARFPLPGRHNLMNAFAAVKAAKNLGISDRKINVKRSLHLLCILHNGSL